jgi:hypothetical protein
MTLSGYMTLSLSGYMTMCEQADPRSRVNRRHL